MQPTASAVGVKWEMAKLQSLLPVSRFTAGVSNSYNLNFAGRAFTINQKEREPSEQKPSSAMWTHWPALRRCNDQLDRMVYFGIEGDCSLLTPLQVLIERCVVFDGSFVVKPRGANGHGAASSNFAPALPPKKLCLPRLSPAARSAF